MATAGLTCPMCKKGLRGLSRECGNCKTDVSLLIDYVSLLGEGLTRAELLTKAGHLGEAVWSYLEVLEVDPDNETARRQVGRVVTAVREFDRHSDGRQWLRSLQNKGGSRSLFGGSDTDLAGCLTSMFWIMLVLGALFIGYLWGQREPVTPPQQPPTTEKPKDPKRPHMKPAED